MNEKWLVKCKRCEYTWTTRSERPKNCPGCGSYLKADDITWIERIEEDG